MCAIPMTPFYIRIHTTLKRYIGIRKALTKTHMETIVRDEAESAAQDVFQRTPGDNNGGGNAGAGSRRRALPKGKEWFIPTLEWQAVKEHHVCPQGLQYKMDVNAGVTMAKAMAKEDGNGGGGGDKGGGRRVGGAGSGGGGGGWMDSITNLFRAETAADRIAAKRARIRAEKAAAKAKVKGSA